MTQPSVSIIIPNLNGRPCLEDCLPAIEALDYPKDLVELLVVDNGSVDGSTYFLRRQYPHTKIVQLAANEGFSAAINRGAEAAGGEILFLLNNDARPAPDCLRVLVEPISSGETVCTAAKIVSSGTATVQFATGGMNFHGVAFQCGEDDAARGGHAEPGPCLFACGGAMAIKRDVFLELGGMDEDFFAYFEDVDLGWRLWSSGFDVQYVPRAVVHHAQSATSRFIHPKKVRLMQLRNPLMMIYKNYEAEFLQPIFPVALMLTARRTWHLAGIDAKPFRIGDELQLSDWIPQRMDPPVPAIPDENIPLPAIAISDLIALNDYLDAFAALETKRRQIQQRRLRSDHDIAPMFLDPFRYCENRIEYRTLQDRLCSAFGVDKLFSV